MINKALIDISKDVIHSLRENEVPESKTLEYKRDINPKAKEDKKEFLADVSSFANTIGGDLIIGIEEKKGIPCAIDGIPIDNIDAYKIRLDSIIRDSIIPILPYYTIKEILLENGNYVIVIRIDESHISPHQVVLDGLLYSREYGGRYYKRHTGGKYPMDVFELKDAFIKSENLSNKIREFRLNRIDMIHAAQEPSNEINKSKYRRQERPRISKKSPYVVLHIIPISYFNKSLKNTIDLFKCYNNDSLFSPLELVESDSLIQFDRQYNFDGLLKFLDIISGYIQIYRNASIETIGEMGLFRQNDNENIFNITYFEFLIIKAIRYYLNNYNKLDINPPFAIYISLLDIYDYQLLKPRNNYLYERSVHQVKRNEILLPELIINSFDLNIEIELKFLFDMVWNAFSLPHSFNYTKENKWKDQW